MRRRLAFVEGKSRKKDVRLIPAAPSNTLSAGDRRPGQSVHSGPHRANRSMRLCVEADGFGTVHEFNQWGKPGMNRDLIESYAAGGEILRRAVAGPFPR